MAAVSGLLVPNNYKLFGDSVTVKDFSLENENKGSVLISDGTEYIEFPVGADDLVLTADSSKPTGVKWAVGGGTGLNWQAEADAVTKVRIGNGSTADDNQVAIGNNAYVEPSSIASIAIGQNARAEFSTDQIAIGRNAHSINDDTIAIGVDSSANGEESVSIGPRSTAGGNKSVAIGANAIITAGEQSVILGSDISVVNSNNTAVGSDIIVGDRFTTAIGNIVRAPEEGSIAIGYDVVANNLNTTAIGRQSSAAGDNSLAVGLLATTTGANATAIGPNTIASGVNALALGNGAAAGANQFSLGVPVPVVENNTSTRYIEVLIQGVAYKLLLA